MICWLKARGVRTVVASDLSAGRRALADAVRRRRRGRPDRGVAVRRRGRQARDLGARPVPVRGRLDGPAAPGARLAPRLPRRGPARRRDAVRSGGLRVRRRPGDDRVGRLAGAAGLAGRRGRGVHGRRQLPAVDGDQQGDRPAVRALLHAAGVPRHPARAGRRQRRRLRAGDRHGRARRRGRAPSTRSATPSGTPRSSSTRRRRRRAPSSRRSRGPPRDRRRRARARPRDARGDRYPDRDRAVYQVSRRSFVFFRTPRPDAVDPETGERYDDVIVFWVDSEEDKQALVLDESTPFFTTPHFDGHPSVLLRGSGSASSRSRSSTEVVQDAWLARAGKRARAAWLAEHPPADASDRPAAPPAPAGPRRGRAAARPSTSSVSQSAKK